MIRGLDYDKLVALFCDQLSKSTNESQAHDQLDVEEGQSTFVERVTLQMNGEVQVSKWQRMGGSVTACERYTYRPDTKEFRGLTRTYGPLVPGKPKTIRKIWSQGRLVKIV